jgi:hypothetical protein
MDKVLKVFLWLVFTVIFGASPLIVRYAISRMDQNPISFSDTLKTGDLLIVSAVVAADAIGRLFGFKHKNGGTEPVKRGIRIVCGCGCLLLFLLACAQYAQVSGRIDEKVKYNTENVVHDSYWIFAGVVLAGLGVILAVEEE